jgi:hypothetical protein
VSDIYIAKPRLSERYSIAIRKQSEEFFKAVVDAVAGTGYRPVFKLSSYVGVQVLLEAILGFAALPGNRERQYDGGTPLGDWMIVLCAAAGKDTAVGLGVHVGGDGRIFTGSVEYVIDEVVKVLKSLSSSTPTTLQMRLSNTLEDLFQASARIVELVEANESLRAELAVRDLHIEYLQRQVDVRCSYVAGVGGGDVWSWDGSG